MSTVDELRTVDDWEAYFDSFGDHLAPVVHEAGPSISVTDAADTVHPEQTAWARQMPKRIYEPVEGRVYVAHGYQLCSTTMIVGDDGVVIVDPGESDISSAELLADLRRFSDLPIKAVIFTHRHPDHCYALNGLGVTAEDVESGAVEIVAHETFEQWLVNDAGLVGPILTARTSLVPFAGFGPDGVVQAGLGPVAARGPMSTHMPTRTVGDVAELEIAGVRIVAFHAYGDAQDEIDLWLPELKHVHGSETVQGETFPNLYTLRGTAYRDVEAWREGVDALLSYARGAETYSGSHMRPWVGNDFIVERITNYRDAIQFLHDQSIRHINKGATGPELVELVAHRLPDHLRDDPWLQPYYGTPEHCVRAIYDGTLGWFSGDATELAAPLHADRARRYVEALGGRDAVLDKARVAHEAEDYGWAAELLTHLVRADPGDTTARHAKAESLRRWGYLQKNIYWRTMAIGGANELDDTIDYSQVYEFQPPDVLNAIPAEKIVAGLRVRLDPEKSADVDLTVAWDFPDTGRSVAVQVRRGVAVVHDVPPGDVDATVTIDAAAVRALSRDITAVDDVLARAADVTDAAVVRRFLGFFDPLPTEPVRLLAR
ncbi:alkyl sulfatase dimerization domain-containing protein [Cellulosimicrobium cellulans]|uniref:alkyl sulfatase dimerization domain-containing protein n=1 Tax=Cellulosimicrobium cellulans TaxID=1710 RepID=UPI002097460E|nr:alkyl sulfatase dimerization domain-containing protein [Cellulosimicrobium cellulans]MCO7273584.1 MBL fold metallo-hydrolase [Cellulosimicrobium cellulans]